MNLAVLITCHNRRETTLACLRRLFVQELPEGVEFTVFLVDDGCTDGTGEAVKREFPSVNIILGDGNLYWNQGMRLAWKTAAEKRDWDGYLWLNDDVQLDNGALMRMLYCYDNLKGTIGDQIILVGACYDPITKHVTYGGKDFQGKVIEGDSQSKESQTMNGNFVLVPKCVFESVGNLSGLYKHAYGDFDYGYRARSMGVKIQSIPGWIGSCKGHGEGSWSNPHVSLGQRWQAFHSPNGLYPSDFYRYKQVTEGNLSAIIYWMNAYRRMLFGLKK